MLFYIITAAINTATSIILGLIVYFKNKKATLNKVFAIFCLSVATWAAFYFFWLILGTTKSIALFLGRALNIAAIFIPVTYFHLITIFLNIYQKNKKVVSYGYLLSFLIFISGFTPLFIRNVEPELFFPWYPKPGITYHIFVLIFFGYVIYSWYLMFKALKEKRGVAETQIKYVLAGTLIGFTGGSTSFFPVYGILIPPFGNVLVPVYVVAITIAILKHRLFNTRVILTELLVVLLSIILLIDVFLSNPLSTKLLKLGILIAFLYLGISLIQSVLNEIKRREEMERISKDLKKAYEDLRVLDKAKSEFVSIASHQLRTPLTVIKGYLSLIQEDIYGKPPEKMERPLRNIYISTERLIRLVNDLLSISRIESGKIKPELEKLSLEDIINSVVTELEPLAEKKNLYLRWEKPKEPMPQVLADKDKIRQVILNLIDNGIRYTEKGGVVVKYKKEKKRCRMIVSDTGPGMEEKEISTLFRSFRRGSVGQKTWTGGTGLGLYIAKKFMDMHKGKIWAESKGKDKGSAFYIELSISR